eukprot:3596528-Prymnesium_polylepis.1
MAALSRSTCTVCRSGRAWRSGTSSSTSSRPTRSRASGPSRSCAPGAASHPCSSCWARCSETRRTSARSSCSTATNRYAAVGGRARSSRPRPEALQGRRPLSCACVAVAVAAFTTALAALSHRPSSPPSPPVQVADILLRDELDAWVKAHPKRLKVVHVIGERPTDPPPKGWESTSTYTAESGWIDQ